MARVAQAGQDGAGNALRRQAGAPWRPIPREQDDDDAQERQGVEKERRGRPERSDDQAAERGTDGARPDPLVLEHKWGLFLELIRWAEGGSCRHDAILRYFGDEAETLDAFLVGAKVGDAVQVQAPKGAWTARVVSVRTA